MKRILKISLIAAALFLSTGVYANDGDFSFTVKPLTEKKIAFFSDKAQVMELSISTADQEVLYQEEIKTKSGATTVYDLSSLLDGTYSFKFQSSSKSIEYQVVITKGETEVSSPKIIEKLQPVFTRDNKIITLNLDNTPTGPIEVQVLDEENEVLYTYSFEGGAKFVKKFNISEVEIDSLTFVLKAKDQELKEVVQVN